MIPEQIPCSWFFCSHVMWSSQRIAEHRFFYKSPHGWTRVNSSGVWVASLPQKQKSWKSKVPVEDLERSQIVLDSWVWRLSCAPGYRLIHHERWQRYDVKAITVCGQSCSYLTHSRHTISKINSQNIRRNMSWINNFMFFNPFVHRGSLKSVNFWEWIRVMLLFVLPSPQN